MPTPLRLSLFQLHLAKDMDFDDDFEDLFDGADLLQASSQETLDESAANISFADVAVDDVLQWERFEDANVNEDDLVAKVTLQEDSMQAIQDSHDHVTYGSPLVS